MKKFLSCIVIFIVFTAGSILCNAPARSLEGTEYQIKAAMMINFFQFVDWPEESDQSMELLTLGIIGADKFNGVLDSVEGRIVNGKRLKLRRFNSTRELNQCQILFVPESESYRADEILKSLNGAPVLTIGETERFTRMGGIIRFYIEENHVRFEINKTAANRSKLKISAKLMEIARVID
jgi:hypothetical protein